MERLNELAPSTWDGHRREFFVTVVSLWRQREVVISQGLPTELGSPVVECIPCTLLFGAHHHGTD